MKVKNLFPDLFPQDLFPRLFPPVPGACVFAGQTCSVVVPVLFPRPSLQTCSLPLPLGREQGTGGLSAKLIPISRFGTTHTQGTQEVEMTEFARALPNLETGGHEVIS